MKVISETTTAHCCVHECKLLWTEEDGDHLSLLFIHARDWWRFDKKKKSDSSWASQLLSGCGGLCVCQHCLNIHKCVSLRPPCFHRLPACCGSHGHCPPPPPSLCCDWFILTMRCSVIGCLADLRTTAVPWWLRSSRPVWSVWATMWRRTSR